MERFYPDGHITSFFTFLPSSAGKIEKFMELVTCYVNSMGKIKGKSEFLPGSRYCILAKIVILLLFAHGDSYSPEKGMIWHVFARSNGQNRKNSYDMPIVISGSYFTALFTPSAAHP